MKRLGLTGGIGMGKSAAAEHLRRRGLPVVDTDRLARELVEPGQPAWHEIRHTFGPEVLDAAGCLRRDALARIVFADAARRRQLEAILHPRIRAAWQAQLETWQHEGRPAAVVVIPLLFETGAAGQFDATICVACSPASQRERLRARGWSDEEIARRLAAQWPVERKIAAADYVVWAEGDLAHTAAQLDRILATLGLAGTLPELARAPAARAGV
jgi:dephospho-CoA kinase